MNTARKPGPHTHTRTEGRAQVRGSEFTTKAATLQGGSEEPVPSLCVVGLGPVAAYAHVYVHEVNRALFGTFG
jgi:hypothetical protein